MNVYASLNEMWNDAIDKVLSSGYKQQSRNGGSTEVIGWSGLLMDTEHNVLINPVRKWSPIYAAAEVLWYLSGERNAKMIMHYAPQYKRFTERGIAFGAYGARIAQDERYKEHELKQRTQLSGVIQLLKDKPDTRQAIISLWNAGDLGWSIRGGKKDLPCTLTLQFLLRGGRLHLIVTMRSNDVWLGLPYDVFAFTCIQRMVAESLGVDRGNYIHQVGSLHIYDSNLEKVKSAREAAVNGRHNNHRWSPDRVPEFSVPIALQVERKVRSGKGQISRVAKYLQVHRSRMIADLVACCARKRYPITPIYSNLLREAFNDYSRGS